MSLWTVLLLKSGMRALKDGSNLDIQRGRQRRKQGSGKSEFLLGEEIQCLRGVQPAWP